MSWTVVVTGTVTRRGFESSLSEIESESGKSMWADSPESNLTNAI